MGKQPHPHLKVKMYEIFPSEKKNPIIVVFTRNQQLHQHFHTIPGAIILGQGPKN